jgi:glycerophosphoryl diester phosphodiesterase
MNEDKLLNIPVHEIGSNVLLVFPVDKKGTDAPYLFRMKCRHCKSVIPDISFEYKKQNGMTIPLYIAPVLNSRDTMDYYLPPLINDYVSIQARLSTSATSIVFDHLSFEECANQIFSDSIITFHAHLGYKPFTPENTLPSFDYCGKCRFRACVVTPIESADGVIFCYHENNPRLSSDDGKTIIGFSAEEFHAMYSNEILSTYDAGIYKGLEWKNTQICTMDDFLAVCSKYDMAPTFSTHPMLSNAGWEYVRKKLKELNLIKKCTIKAFDANVLRKAYSYFGADIHRYVYDAPPTRPIEEIINALRRLDFQNVSLGIELPMDNWEEEKVKSVTKEGIVASAYSIGQNGRDIRKLVSWGVTEFTSDSFIMYSNWMSL